MARHMLNACGLLSALIAWHVPAPAEQAGDHAPVSERPSGGVTKTPPLHQNWYGMCTGPQNADAFPMSPVLVIAGQCENWQRYTATSPGPSTGGNCGGFTVAFGPKGDLKPYLDRVNLVAEWGDTPLTQAQCAKAKVTAIGWGARCTARGCSSGQWERIGNGPKQRSGTWNSVSKVCYISANFVSADKKYITLNLDIVATLDEGGQEVRKRAKGTITASRPNGKCLSAPAQPAKK